LKILNMYIIRIEIIYKLISTRSLSHVVGRYTPKYCQPWHNTVL